MGVDGVADLLAKFVTKCATNQAPNAGARNGANGRARRTSDEAGLPTGSSTQTGAP